MLTRVRFVEIPNLRTIHPAIPMRQTGPEVNGIHTLIAGCCPFAPRIPPFSTLYSYP